MPVRTVSPPSDCLFSLRRSTARNEQSDRRPSQESKSAKLVDLFLWSDMTGLVAARFHQRTYEGVVILDLSLGPNALFREFSQTRRIDIRRAMKYGVSVDFAKSREDISAYYTVYAD